MGRGRLISGWFGGMAFIDTAENYENRDWLRTGVPVRQIQDHFSLRKRRAESASCWRRFLISALVIFPPSKSSPVA